MLQRRHRVLIGVTMATLTLGCGAERSKPGPTLDGPPLGKGVNQAKGPAATSAVATRPHGVVTLPKATSNSELTAGAPAVLMDEKAKLVLRDTQGMATALPDPSSAHSAGPVAPWARALEGARKGGEVLNAHIDASLGAGALWNVMQSASRAGFTEIRVAVAGGGALAIQMPQVASPRAPLPGAAHLALFIGKEGANAKVFIGPSGAVFPAASVAGGVPITTLAQGCPAAPRANSGRVTPAVVRALGEPLCSANDKKDYWIVVAPDTTTRVGETVRLTAAAATPKSGCTPRIAVAAPAAAAALTNCSGAVTTEALGGHIARRIRQGDHSALRAAARKPLITEIDLSKRGETVAPAMAAKLKKQAESGTGTVALGRIATSDQDASRGLVTTAMRAHLAEIKQCYLDHVKAAGSDRAFSGSLTIGMQITKDGRSNKAGFSKRGNPPEDLKLCVALKAKSWTFQAPGGGKPVQAMIPVVLRPPTSPR